MTLGERIRRNEREEKMRIRKEGRKQGRKEGIKEGREEGIKEGREEGIIDSINKTMKKMLQLKLDESIIKEVTGVKDEELEKVKKELLEV